MRLYHCTLLAVVVTLFSASDAAVVASEVSQAKRAESDTALSALSLTNGYDSGPTLRSLRGKDKTHENDVATNDDSVEDPATSEERIVVPSSIKGVSNKMSTSLFKSLVKSGINPVLLAERLRIKSPGTPARNYRLYKRFTEWFRKG
ncbi:hypothetical protein KRP22_014972 [Phytophthora ramorum]